MPNIYEGGDELPTPEETVAELLKQGDTPEEIIAEAELAIHGRGEPGDPDYVAGALPGIEWVDAVAGRWGEYHGAAQTILEGAKAALAPYRPEEVALAGEEIAKRVRHPRSPAYDALRHVHGATQDVEIHAGMRFDSVAAADQHRKNAQETISNARRRIAAAEGAK